MREAPRFIRGVSLLPGKICRYSIPESWILHGYPGSTPREGAAILTREEKDRANRRRIISRYWQAVGWLWLRSKRTRIDLPSGKHLNHRQGMLTLTLPGVATADHKQVKNLILDPFLTYSRNVLGLLDYVWVAELQERGEIHFHMILNQFLPKDKVREAWLRCCDASGIIQGSKAGYRPATRIEECLNYKGSRAYAAKYMAKALRSGAILGRIWSGSHSVTAVGKLSTNEVEQSFNVPAVLLEINAMRPVWLQYDHGIEVARFDIGSISKRTTPVLHRLFQSHLAHFDNPPETHASPDLPAPAISCTSLGQAPRLRLGGDLCVLPRHTVDRDLSGPASSVHVVGVDPAQAVARSEAYTPAQAHRRDPDLWDLLP